MNHKDFKKLYREYENINAPSGLKYRILSAAERDPRKNSRAGKIAAAASIAAALLIGVVVICAASLFNGNEESSKMSQLVSNGAAETSPVEVPEEIPAEIPAKAPADAVRLIQVSPEKVFPAESAEEAAIPAIVISDTNGLILPDPEEEPADKETDNLEQPVMRVADAEAAAPMDFDDANIQAAAEVTEKAVPDSIFTEIAFNDEISPEITPVGDNDDISTEISPDGEPEDPDLYRLRDQEDPDWSLLKDHDTDMLQVDYDPMLFNDKERPIYESCDHEWTSEIWPGGEVIVCSKCGVHLDMWLYNGYSE